MKLFSFLVVLRCDTPIFMHANMHMLTCKASVWSTQHMAVEGSNFLIVWLHTIKCFLHHNNMSGFNNLNVFLDQCRAIFVEKVITFLWTVWLSLNRFFKKARLSPQNNKKNLTNLKHSGRLYCAVLNYTTRWQQPLQHQLFNFLVSFMLQFFRMATRGTRRTGGLLFLTSDGYYSTSVYFFPN